MSRKAKGPGFTQRSGKSPAFKMMGSSSPVKYEGDLSVHDEEAGYGPSSDIIVDGKKVGTKRQALGTVTSSGGVTSSSAPEGVYTDPNDPGVNRTWVHPEHGATMYRHPDGHSSSKPYDPTKAGVATHGDDRGYFDYMGQKATSGIEELKAKQSRGRRSSTARQAFFSGNRPDPLSNLSTDDFWSQYSF